MKTLEQRILKDGRCLPGGILKVDGFINQQIDPVLMEAMADEFSRLFADSAVNKIQRHCSRNNDRTENEGACSLRQEKPSEHNGKHSVDHCILLHQEPRI